MNPEVQVFLCVVLSVMTVFLYRIYGHVETISDRLDQSDRLDRIEAQFKERDWTRDGEGWKDGVEE